jgi:hypothetical protein
MKFLNIAELSSITWAINIFYSLITMGTFPDAIKTAILSIIIGLSLEWFIEQRPSGRK